MLWLVDRRDVRPVKTSCTIFSAQFSCKTGGIQSRGDPELPRKCSTRYDGNCLACVVKLMGGQFNLPCETANRKSDKKIKRRLN